jgi:hypothetical protein
LAAGLLTVGIAVLTFATPELFAPKWDTDSMVQAKNASLSFDKEMCLTSDQLTELKDQCTLDAPNEVNKNLWAFVLLGLAQVLLGIGSTAPIVLAMPFIDDNVKTKNTPIYFGASTSNTFLCTSNFSSHFFLHSAGLRRKIYRTCARGLPWIFLSFYLHRSHK